jgi:phytoene dehydrogenase-like protein
MTNRYDDIVVGSGISGLTMCLLLARTGRRVLLLEKAAHIGGSVARFSRSGIPFDVGFHFTGGLQDGGILHDILSVLGIRDLVRPRFMPNEHAASFVFEDVGSVFDHPAGVEKIKKQFKEYFPGDASAVERYFAMVTSVCSRTPSMDLRTNVVAPPTLDEDFLSLDEVLRGLTENKTLRGLLSGYAMLYGVKPKEISFANHSRMCLSFYESIACLVDGGDAFVNAFKAAFRDLDVEVRCRTFITELADIRDEKAGRFVLNTGGEITAENCILTIHPKEIVKMLPQNSVSRAFRNRVSAFEPSAGFFSVFATLEQDAEDPYPDQAIVSLFPTSDVNDLLDPASGGEPALVIIKTADDTAAGAKSIHVLAPSFAGHVAQWQDSRTGKRPKEYYEYKEQQTRGILDHIYRWLPGYRGRMKVVDCASVLTFRDYLNSPDGSAYGVKQKIGQFNLVGKLPVRNLYAAGQSAVLPGVIGAMMSSLIVGRTVMGKDRYGALLMQGLCS